MKLALFAIALSALAQQPPPAPAEKPVVQKIFQIKHADVHKLGNTLGMFGTVRVDASMRVISFAATPEAMAAIEDAIKRLDVPQPTVKNVELTFSMVLAGNKPSGLRVLPAELEGVARNLTSLFGYKTFGLLDVAVLRSRDGEEASSSGIAPGLQENASPSAHASYFLRCRPSVVSIDKGYSIRLDRTSLKLRVPIQVSPQSTFSTAQYQFQELAIETNLDVREGQKVVVGKTNVDNTSDTALVLVVTAKVVE